MKLRMLLVLSVDKVFVYFSRIKMFLALEVELAMLFLVIAVHSIPVDFKEQNDVEPKQKESTTPECYYKIIGEQGAIYSSHSFHQNTTCEWSVDVRKGYAVVLEFEYFKLPVVEEQTCETYIEISYGSQNHPVKRRICPTDEVDRIHTDSQVVIIRYHLGVITKDYASNQFGFKILYTAIATANSNLSSNPVMIVLVFTFGSIFVIALCLLCSRRRVCCLNPRGVPSQATAPQEPNAPSRQEIQEIFELQRSMMRQPQREPRKMSFSIFQSESSSLNNSNLRRWNSNEQLHSATTYTVPKTAEKEISIGTTPRSVFPELRRKWSEENLRRIDHLRTKLVARFSSVSSHNSSNMSIFFPASDRNVYSQLSCDEDNELEKSSENVQQREVRTSSSVKNVPSIVIEFVE